MSDRLEDAISHLQDYAFRISEMAEALSGKEIYIKNGSKYIPLGSIVAGKIKFDNGNTLDIGKVEQIFEAELSDADKKLMQQMQINFEG